jgi:hypothetical protein
LDLLGWNQQFRYQFSVDLKVFGEWQNSLSSLRFRESKGNDR